MNVGFGVFYSPWPITSVISSFKSLSLFFAQLCVVSFFSNANNISQIFLRFICSECSSASNEMVQKILGHHQFPDGKLFRERTVFLFVKVY